MSVCTPTGRACYNELLANNSFCLDLAPPCQGYYADMTISYERGNSRVSEENIEDEIYVLEYEEYKGKIVDAWNKRISDVVSDLGLIGNNLSLRKRVCLEILTLFTIS